MATTKQIEANIKNSQLAGVKTNEGKEIVSQNSLKHSLTSEKHLFKSSIFSDSEEIYNELVIGLEGEFKPKTKFEQELVLRMAKCLIKLRRIDFLETQNISEEDVLFKNEKKLMIRDEAMDLLLRYSRAIEGQLYRALATLKGNPNGF